MRLALARCTSRPLNRTRSQSTQTLTTRITHSQWPSSYGEPSHGSVTSTDRQPLPYSGSVIVPSPSDAFLGRSKISDNNSPLPRDRVFLDYDYFHNAALTNPTDVNRFIPGFEKTFFDGLASVEVRVPMGATQSNTFDASSSTIGTNGQFGNLGVVVKAIILQDDDWTFSGGMGVEVPTAPDIDVSGGGAPLLSVKNQSVHLLPFFGAAYQPNEDWFAQGWIQVDVGTNGDPVYVTDGAGGQMQVASLSDQTIIFADALLGRWLYREDDQGLAGVVEVHYAANTSNASSVNLGPILIGGTTNFNMVDMTVGAHYQIGKTVATVGYGTPLTSDRGFDGEMKVLLNRYF